MMNLTCSCGGRATLRSINYSDTSLEAYTDEDANYLQIGCISCGKRTKVYTDGEHPFVKPLGSRKACIEAAVKEWEAINDKADTSRNMRVGVA